MPTKSKSAEATDAPSSGAADSGGNDRLRAEIAQFLAAHPFPTLDLTDTLDLLMFGQLIDALPLEDALRAYEALKANFVDWNEVRISTLGELDEIFHKMSDPTDFSTGVKEFLNRLFTEHHHVGVDFLTALGNMEIKTFFKRSQRVPESAILLLMERLKEYPVIPLTAESVTVVERLGWVDSGATLLQKQKEVYAAIDRGQLVPLHVLLLEHARGTLSDRPSDCPACSLETKKAKKTAKKAAKKKTAAKATKKATKKKTTKASAKKKVAKSAKKKTKKKTKTR